MVFILHLERLPGPGARVHVQQPSILEELQEKQQQQGSGVVQVTSHTHTHAQSHDLPAARSSRSVRALQDAEQTLWPFVHSCMTAGRAHQTALGTL